MTAVARKGKRKPRKAVAQGELERWAKIEILPWPHTSTPGPSHDQWIAWNNQHGAMLRIACGVMMMTKDALAELAGDFERDNKFDELLANYDNSIEFFTKMAKTIEAAKFRLLVGSAVFGLRMRDSPNHHIRPNSRRPARRLRGRRAATLKRAFNRLESGAKAD